VTLHAAAAHVTCTQSLASLASTLSVAQAFARQSWVEPDGVGFIPCRGLDVLP